MQNNSSSVRSFRHFELKLISPHQIKHQMTCSGSGRKVKNMGMDLKSGKTFSMAVLHLSKCILDRNSAPGDKTRYVCLYLFCLFVCLCVCLFLSIYLCVCDYVPHYC